MQPEILSHTCTNNLLSGIKEKFGISGTAMAIGEIEELDESTQEILKLRRLLMITCPIWLFFSLCPFIEG